jgi:hypothetical protein
VNKSELCTKKKLFFFFFLKRLFYFFHFFKVTDSPKLQKAKSIAVAENNDSSTASTADTPKRHNKSKTANNGASHFDLTELSAVLRGDTRVPIERTQVAHLAARTAICCDVCGENIVAALWRRPLARGFMLKRGAVSCSARNKGQCFFFFFFFFSF